MNSELILPELKVSNTKPYLKIMGTEVFIGGISKHEYALALTVTRLIFKAIEHYNQARLGTIAFYNSRNTISFTSLLFFSNNIESLVSDLYRLAKVFRKLINEYPKYKNALPADAESTIREIKDKTYILRNDAEHIDVLVIGEKVKREKKMGLINFGLDRQNILIAKDKISIAELTGWIEKLSGYGDIISKTYN